MDLQLTFRDTTDGQLPIHISRPDRDPTAAVIVCHHAIGIYQDNFQKRFSDQLAACGFLVALPDFYHRAWAGTVVADSKGAGMQQKDMPVVPLIRSVSDDHLKADLAATIQMLEDEGVSRIGVCGFCLGGRTAWLAGCSLPDRVQAVVMYHGGNLQVPLNAGISGFAKMAVSQVVGTWASRLVPGSGQPSPWELRSALTCPVLGHFGALDKNPSPQDAQMFQNALGSQGVRAEFHIYAEANHGFSCADSDAYQQEAADQAWQRTANFLCHSLGLASSEPLPRPPGREPGTQTGEACTSGCEEIRRSKQ